MSTPSMYSLDDLITMCNPYLTRGNVPNLTSVFETRRPNVNDNRVVHVLILKYRELYNGNLPLKDMCWTMDEFAQLCCPIWEYSQGSQCLMNLWMDYMLKNEKKLLPLIFDHMSQKTPVQLVWSVSYME